MSITLQQVNRYVLLLARLKESKRHCAHPVISSVYSLCVFKIFTGIASHLYEPRVKGFHYGFTFITIFLIFSFHHLTVNVY